MQKEKGQDSRTSNNKLLGIGTMDRGDVAIKISKLDDPLLKEVAILLINLDLEFIASRDETKIVKGKRDFGHIDLLLKHKQLKRIFFIEVSTKQKKRGEKINHFFKRWTSNEEIEEIQKKFDLPVTYKIVRIYFELSGKEELPVTANYFNSSQGNYVLNSYDFNYFKDALVKVGSWAKNDFFSYLDIKPAEKPGIEKSAIQYFLGDKRAYVYVDTVANLLGYCYVSRRKRDSYDRAKVDIGYQRILNMDRIGNIAKKIKDPHFFAFPNAILLSCPEKKQLCNKPKKPTDCPGHVKISIPSQFCSCRVIDGQHRLLGFARVEESYQETRSIPVVILEDITQEDEMTTFIEINNEQKKIDRNLILALEADRDWDINTNKKQFFEKQAVEIAKRLNNDERSPLRDMIFIPDALARRNKKITLTTFVSGIIRNNFIGGRLHLLQRDYNDSETPFLRIKEIFVLLRKKLPKYCRDTDSFLLGNRGLNILFRLVQTFERNLRRGYIEIEFEQFFDHLAQIFNDDFVERLDAFFYGAGGTNRAVANIFETLKDRYKKEYERFCSDLRSV